MQLVVQSFEDKCSVVQVPDVELDASNSLAFRRAVTPLLQSGRHVVLDLSNVSFMDSSGIGALLYALRTAAANGRMLKLTGVTSPVRMIFSVVRMYSLFDVYDNPKVAVQSIGT
jgi:anti-sigma B factor antagonist